MATIREAPKAKAYLFKDRKTMRRSLIVSKAQIINQS
jgi:hypothetical protein